MFDKPINAGKLPYTVQVIGEKDLSQMYLFNDKALIARCSDRISFFKLVKDEYTKEKKWTNYTTLDVRGFVFQSRNGNMLQITTD